MAVQLRIVVEANTSDLFVRNSIVKILDEMLPYMVDNVAISSHQQEPGEVTGDMEKLAQLQELADRFGWEVEADDDGHATVKTDVYKPPAGDDEDADKSPLEVIITNEERIIIGAVNDFVDGKGISELQAKVIASQWHGGQASALYSFASTGAINDEAIRGELYQTLKDQKPFSQDDLALQALTNFIISRGSRGPQSEWPLLRW